MQFIFVIFECPWDQVRDLKNLAGTAGTRLKDPWYPPGGAGYGAGCLILAKNTRVPAVQPVPGSISTFFNADQVRS
jgi:hypothetical protein